jgi:hypothetical protein
MGEPPVPLTAKQADVSNLAPLSILYDPTIAALGAFALAVAVLRRVSVEEALAAAGEVGRKFGVDVEFSAEGIKGVDADLVRGAAVSWNMSRRTLMTAYCDDYLAFGRLDLYDVGPFDNLPVRLSGSACSRSVVTDCRHRETHPNRLHACSSIMSHVYLPWLEKGKARRIARRRMGTERDVRAF